MGFLFQKKTKLQERQSSYHSSSERPTSAYTPLPDFNIKAKLEAEPEPEIIATDPQQSYRLPVIVATVFSLIIGYNEYSKRQKHVAEPVRQIASIEPIVEQLKIEKPTAAKAVIPTAAELEGEWIGDNYQACTHDSPQEKISMVAEGNKIVATKITGDCAVHAGEITMQADLTNVTDPRDVKALLTTGVKNTLPSADTRSHTPHRLEIVNADTMLVYRYNEWWPLVTFHRVKR